MGKKKNNSGGSSLGRALIKDRFANNRGRKMVSDNSMLHTTELNDGYEWGRLNLQSVTEESSFQEFLSTAELAGTEFQAEKLNIKFVNPQSNVGLLTDDEFEQVNEAHNKFRENLKIPRRPPWSTDMSPDELDRNEKESFLNWRRTLAKLQEDQGLLLTPYEKNLEFWRQLWRVVERSDVVVQIVDARNPLLFRCEDLEKYVREVSPNKINLVLINKADFLTSNQRHHWAEYFQSLNLRAVFFSALEQTEKTQLEVINESEVVKDLKGNIAKLERSVEENAEALEDLLQKIETLIGDTTLREEVDDLVVNSSQLLTREELIELFRTVHMGPKVTEGTTTIGLVGYPNVGKSSTINCLMSAKKVSVSATPGKTKHFQTLFLDKEILLCDCPGLVMPSFVFTKAEMILNGILPIDQMRDHVPPVNLVSKLVPRHVLEDKYGILLPKPLEGEDPDRPPIAEELLNAYAYNRGFMTANGQPDNSRAARYVLKDFMNGKLLYCHAPPGIPQEIYHTWPERQKVSSENRVLPPREARAIRTLKVTTDDIDKSFFSEESQVAHSKGVAGKAAGVPAQGVPQDVANATAKPWKVANKHKNKKKKEKLRRVYAHLDQH
ncbi:large subunit GTPase 1 homolog [Anthonomus grandis grandis]|uniref:large subunit GTPase 1 homolog n=1 Tax=Anthonomus grandis grandis TaxID=2921223 RepID=UPI002165598E|nr:large subunit GTPase 1 homolog [Anthonomus grandis grandis]